MKMELSGTEEINAGPQALWDGLNDPEVLKKCIPGCKEMIATGPDAYDMKLQLKVAAVGGSFDGKVRLFDKAEPESCHIEVSGGGTLGTGEGAARFTISDLGEGKSALSYEGEGEIGGLVAGVGQRVLKSVAKHLTKQFFTALKRHFAEEAATA